MFKSKFRGIIKADLYLRALTCVSQEETRYYLNGVNIQPCDKGGVLLVSTDGHRLLCFRDKNGYIEDRTAIVRCDPLFLTAFKRVMRGAKFIWLSPTSTIYLVIDGQVMGLIEGAGDNAFDGKPEEAFSLLADPSDKRVHAIQCGGALIDGTFPDWRRVIPKAETLMPSEPLGVLNTALLKSVVDALTEEGQVPAPRITGSGAGSPHLIRVSEREIEGFGVVMPMRANAASTLPDWILPPAPPTPAEEPPRDPSAMAPAPATSSDPAVNAAARKKAKRNAARKPAARKRPAPKNAPRRAAPVRKPAKKAATKKAAKKRGAR